MNKHFRGFEELLSVTSSRIHYSMAPPEMGALSLPSTLQTKSVHWKVVAFGPLVSGAIWVGKLVNWGYSVLNHSQLMCCGRSHSLCKSSFSSSSSFLFILQTIKALEENNQFGLWSFLLWSKFFSWKYNFKYRGILDVFCFSNKMLIVISFIMWRFKNLLWMHSFEFS